MVKRIAVLGAGLSGLGSIKCCLDDGLEVTCYELLKDIGGMWRYYEEEKEGVASLMKSTIINSSKEMSAYSDFPPPAHFPNYMHNSCMLKYLELYVEKFNLAQYIKFEHKVLNVSQSNDYDSTGRWVVKVLDVASGIESEGIFDGVMVCTGHLADPKVPRLKGLDSFKGDVLHTHSYKKPNGFENKNILVVGVGNSGGDAATELSSIAKKVYLSTRHGCWVLQRVGPMGMPFDTFVLRRIWQNFIFDKLLGKTLFSKILEMLLNYNFDHSKYNLTPKHRALGQHPLVNDILAVRVMSGLVDIKRDIERFTPNGVIFESDPVEYPLDKVILATGYFIKFPFLNKDVIDTKDNRCDLFKFVFPMHLKHPSLAFIGLAQPFGALQPIAEIQARWFSHLMARGGSLPEEKKMREYMDEYMGAMNKRYVSSTRHTIQVDFVQYMDSIAEQFGVKPNFLHMLVTNPSLFWKCITGPQLPYYYRLYGPGKWKHAEEAINTSWKRILTPLKTTHTPRDKSNTSMLHILGYFLVLLILLYVFKII